MKPINFHSQTTKRQVSGPTIHPDQIKKNLGVTLTSQQKEAFKYVAAGTPAHIHPKTEMCLIAKNLIRKAGGTYILTEKGKAYWVVING